MIVVDDHLLLDVLDATIRPQLADLLLGHEIATTPSWYFRLARAVASERTEGSLTRRFADLAAQHRRQLQTALASLPDSIALVDARIAITVMVAVSEATRANLLTAEAIATSLIFDANIAVSIASPLLADATRTGCLTDSLGA